MGTRSFGCLSRTTKLFTSVDRNVGPSLRPRFQVHCGAIRLQPIKNRDKIMIKTKLFHGFSIKHLVLILLSGCLLAWPATRSSHRGTPFNGCRSSAEGAASFFKQQGAYSSIAEAMAAARYGVYDSRHTIYSRPGEQFYANNPAQGYRAFFSDNKMRLSIRKGAANPLAVTMELSGYGYGDDLVQIGAGRLTATGNRVEISKPAINNPKSAVVTEWYVNDQQGLEQGFTLLVPPSKKDPQGERLSLRVEVSGDLLVEADPEGKGAKLKDENGRTALNYNNLTAFDAAGRELESRMKVEGSQVWLEVDDQEAQYPVIIDPIFSQVQKLIASDGAANDWFGNSVAVSCDTVVVGAFNDDDNGNASGAAYIFERNQGGADNWGQVKKLTASDASANSSFGVSVAISKNTVVVGANNKNAAYVFEQNKGGADNWGQVRKLTGSDTAAFDLFGESVAVSVDTIAVGALGDDDSGSNSGSAYVFDRNSGGVDSWGQVAKITAADGAANDVFGRSVSISCDSVVVGAFGDDDNGNNSGSAYIFQRNRGGLNNWAQVTKITASDAGALDQFGGSVSISCDALVVGAAGNDDNGGNSGSAYIFERTQGGANNWGQVKKLTASDAASGDLFGDSVAISTDTVVISAEFGGGNIQHSGSAYIFELNTGGVENWGEVAEITASDGATNDIFGWSVAVSCDTIVIGAISADGNTQNSGSAYLFTQQCNEWVEQEKVGTGSNRFGESVSISRNIAIVSDPGDDDFGLNSGAVYVLERNQAAADQWGHIKKLTASDPAAFDFFGYSVAISCDTVVVGVPFKNNSTGAAYIFGRNHGGPDDWGQVRKLVAFDGGNFQMFGKSVSLGEDIVVIGAPGDDDNGAFSGSAYVSFRNSGGADNWGLPTKIKAPDGAASDQFGSSVAISGQTVVVGAFDDDDDNGNSSGSVYVFDPIAVFLGSCCFQAKKITTPDGAADDRFGISVAISGDTIVVGAPGDDDNGDASGSAYLLERNQGGANNWGEVTKIVAVDAAPGDGFGVGVAIDSDTVVITAPGDDANGDLSGAAYIFERNQGGADNWDQLSKITSSDGTAGDIFGGSFDGGAGELTGGDQAVAISCDTVIVGAPGAGFAYIFTTTCSSQQQIQAIIEMVDDLVIEGALTTRQAAALKANLNRAIAMLDQGMPRLACSQLEAFVNQVRTFVNGRVLTPMQARPLVYGATAVRAGIC